MIKRFIPLLVLILFAYSLAAQQQKDFSSAEIYKKIEKLNFLGTVLYVAAHPDDENTSMISYLSNYSNARVGYLSINRGDGGQNLIGTQINELLGVIRTEELMAARKIDGGEQFFTRAIDFGFSKNPAETFNIWNKQEVLEDVVWIFRKFRPDVVINRFNHRTEGDTHGHHTASAVLSVEAFDLAGKKEVYPEQLEFFSTWQPNRMYFNDSWFFYGSKEKYLAADHEGFLEINVGKYLPLLGKSNNEISALSRSQHQSQGFGSAGERGEDLHFIEPIKGDLKNASEGIFKGIDTSWNRIKGGKAIGKILYKVQQDFDFEHPEKSIPKLLKAYQLIQNLEDEYWKELKTNQIKEIIIASAGLFLEASTKEEFAGLEDEIKINFEAVNRSETKIKLKEVEIISSHSFKYNQILKSNKKFHQEENFKIPSNTNYSSPYWLENPHSIGLYNVEDKNLLGLPTSPPSVKAQFKIEINEIPFVIERELIYKTVDQIQGEIKEPFAVVPEVSLKMQNEVLVFPDNESREIKVEVKALKDHVKGILSFEKPDEWKIFPEETVVEFDRKSQTKTLTFTLTPPENQMSAEINPVFAIDNKQFSKELHQLDFPHIPLRNILLPAKTKVNRIDIKISGKNIAYINGAGDKIPTGLREIGYEVDEISAENLQLDQLKKYDAVITGIRAYNVNDDLVLHQNVLFEYVKQGGTLITQYSQLMGIKTKKTAPYKMTLGRGRVTDENSKINFLNPEHAVFNFPNKITQADFEGWVQERGLYFAEDWDSKFTAVLGMRDQGEEEQKGSLLISKYGQGYYVYTGLSFFRQFPAGVPGAYRLFANLLALGSENYN